MSKVYLYSPRSMDFFAKRAIELFGWERFYPIDSKRFGPEVTVIFWLYSAEDYLIFKDSKVVKRVYWMGSDARFAVFSPDARKILKDTPAIHACMGQTQADLLRLIGINSTVRPIFFGNPERYNPRPQGEEIQDIYINVNQGREEEYGLIHFLQAAQAMPEKRFHVFGIDKFIEMPNVIYYGRLPEEQYDSITDDFDLYVMGHVNAGYPQSAAKAAMRGQRVISINPRSFKAFEFAEYIGIKHLVSNMQGLFPEVPETNNFDWI